MDAAGRATLRGCGNLLSDLRGLPQNTHLFTLIEIMFVTQGDLLVFAPQVSYIPRLLPWALESPQLQKDYHCCWKGLGKHFDKSCAHGSIGAEANCKSKPVAELEEGPA